MPKPNAYSFVHVARSAAAHDHGRKAMVALVRAVWGHPDDSKAAALADTFAAMTPLCASAWGVLTKDPDGFPPIMEPPTPAALAMMQVAIPRSADPLTLADLTRDSKDALENYLNERRALLFEVEALFKKLPRSLERHDALCDIRAWQKANERFYWIVRSQSAREYTNIE